jgi:hypothetical protein
MPNVYIKATSAPPQPPLLLCDYRHNQLKHKHSSLNRFTAISSPSIHSQDALQELPRFCRARRCRGRYPHPCREARRRLLRLERRNEVLLFHQQRVWSSRRPRPWLH